MSFSSWLGTVGYIRPTYRPGGMEELIRLLPDGVGIIPLFNPVRQGTEAEFKVAVQGYETKVAELAEIGVDLINPSGAPPFMVLGYRGEQELVRKWEERYGVPIFTSGMTHIDAMRALGVRRFVGASYFGGEINKIYGQYFRDAGLECLAMAGLDVPFDKVQELSSQVVYRFVKRLFLDNPGAEAIYMLGPGWRTLDIVETLEQDCGVPVVHAVPSQCWDIQRRLHIRRPVKGYGRLLAELP